MVGRLILVDGPHWVGVGLSGNDSRGVPPVEGFASDIWLMVEALGLIFVHFSF